MTSYMEYDEVEVPEDIQNRLEKLSQIGDPKNPATLKAAGLLDWVNKRSREEGWRICWQAFNFPFIMFEREVVMEEVKN